MSWLGYFSESFSRNSQKYQSLFIPDERVEPLNYDPAPIKAGEAYCRLWLANMQLARDVDWFKERYPVVHAAVRFDRGDKKVTIPYLAKPLQAVTKENLGQVIQEDYPLTPLFPFNQGLVELQAGLFGMVDSDAVAKFIATMGRFSELLPVPELSTVLNIAEPLYRGIEDLLGAGDGQLELGYQKTFAPAGGGGSNELKAGYFAVILAEERQVNPDNLCVVNGNLRTGSPGNTRAFVKDSRPLEGYSYMLFRLEKRLAQDWESLTKIKEWVYLARDAVFKENYGEVKKILLPGIKMAIYRSADLTKADRRGMVLRIEDYLKEIGLQGASEQRRSLYSIMQRPLPAVDAETEAELAALERLFG